MESEAVFHVSGTEIGTTFFARSHPLSSKQISPRLEASWAQVEAYGQLLGQRPRACMSPVEEFVLQAA